MGQGVHDVHDRCKRFASIFDDNGDGLIELDELGSQAVSRHGRVAGKACCHVVVQFYIYKHDKHDMYIVDYCYTCMYIYITIIHYTKYI
jgi:hypothetical protein